MALPAMIILFIFAYLPLPGMLIAFKDYKAVDGVWGSPWVDGKTLNSCLAPKRRGGSSAIHCF